MTEKTVRLLYPTTLINVPVIHQLIRQFDVTINILRAQITDEQGWLEIMVSGPEGEISRAFDWLGGLKIAITELPPRSEG